MAFEKDENELGCLWQKSGAKGDYFTGTLEINGEKIAIVAFRNGNKKSDKSPDWRILKSRPKVEAGVPF